MIEVLFVEWPIVVRKVPQCLKFLFNLCTFTTSCMVWRHVWFEACSQSTFTCSCSQGCWVARESLYRYLFLNLENACYNFKILKIDL